MHLTRNSKTLPDTVTLESGLVVPAHCVRRDSPFVKNPKIRDPYIGGIDLLARLTGAKMALQGFQDAPLIDPPVAALGTLSATTIEAMWPGIVWTPIYAADARAGKVYHVRMFGTCSLTGGTAIITPSWGPAATTLGVSLTQGTSTCAAAGMYLAFDLLVQAVSNTSGANSKVMGAGFWTFGGGVVSGTGLGQIVTFGGTQASVDTTINGNVTISKTLSAVNAFIVQSVFIYSGR